MRLAAAVLVATAAAAALAAAALGAVTHQPRARASAGALALTHLPISHVEMASEWFRLRVSWGAVLGDARVFVWIDAMQIATNLSTALSFSDNLLVPFGVEGALTLDSLSTSGLLSPDCVEGFCGAWAGAAGPHVEVLARNGSDIVALELSGLFVGNASAPVAAETWQLALDGASLSWAVQREFVADANVLGDRAPALVLSTVGSCACGWSSVTGPQVVSALDAGLFLNESAAAFFPFFTNESAQNAWFEGQSTSAQVLLTLGPSGNQLVAAPSGGLLSLAKVALDGPSFAMAVGVAATDRRNGLTRVSKGTQQSLQLSLLRWVNITADPPLPLVLSLPPALRALETQAKDFAALHNMFFGWFMGNSPASVVCLHEMGYFPALQSLFAVPSSARRRSGRHAATSWSAAPPFPRPYATDLVERELEFLASAGVNASGYVMPRFSAGGFYPVVWGPLHDQIPHFILAFYYHAVVTGDAAWLAKWFPVVLRVASYMTAQYHPRDGVFVVPGSSGLNDSLPHASNWYDIIEFGYEDALVNAYCVKALEAVSKMASFVGDNATSAEFANLHEAAVAAFNARFWNAETGFYADWIDEAGRSRSYFYVDVNLLAIIFGVASPEQKTSVLARLDERYAALAAQFNISVDAIYSTPANMFNVSVGDQVANSTGQVNYPEYENGSAFFHSLGLEMAARAMAGDAGRALAIFQRAMAVAFAPPSDDPLREPPNRFWAVLLDWSTGTLSGEPTNTNMVALWGFLRGAFGVWPELDRIVVSNAPAPQLEGASYVFPWRGANYEARVEAGKVIIAPAAEP